MGLRAGRARGMPAGRAGRVLGVVAGGVVALLFVSAVVVPGFRGHRPVDPVALQVGGFALRWYGLLITASLVPAWALARAYLAPRGVGSEQLATIAWATIPAGLAGARLAYVLQNTGSYLAHPLQALAVWEGGLSIHGAVAAGLLALAAAARKLGLPFLLLADGLMPSVLLAQGIGRWGNFFNYELFGYPTAVPWKMFVPPVYRPLGFEAAAYFHPTFLYESLWDLAGALALLALRRRPGARRGESLFAYLAIYSTGRFWVEFFRIGEPAALGLTLAQWVSLALVAAGLLGLGLAWRSPVSAARPG